MASFSKPQQASTMVFAFLALLQFTAALQHGAHHQHSMVHRSVPLEVHAQLDVTTDELNKRQNSGGRIAITGVCSSGTDSQGVCNPGRVSAPRLELRTLQQNPDQWNLYLLGMERFMAKNKNDPLSYYQVVGVHGRPYVSWGGFPTPLVHQAGFCPHAQALFGSWHRPYLALYEQALYQSMEEVVATFPSSDQNRLRNALQSFRMPYWDWAMDPGTNQPTVPTSMRDQTVSVTKPSGKVTIPNPLYSYSWGSSIPSEIGGGPWDSWPTTLRRPVANPTRSNNNEMNARFNSIRISLRDRLFALFASKANWGMASTSQIGVRTDLSGNGVDSYESVHDSIHNTAGGESGGHMYYLDISSYDPLFWLHHTNVDRLLAMHQMIAPNTWVANANIQRDMGQWSRGESKNAYTPLKPFTKDTAGNYFTSQDIKETRVLGYYYPETSERTYSQTAREVSRQYGAGARSISKRDDTTGQYLGRPFKEGDYHTVLSVTADKFSEQGSYMVHCFIGKPKIDPKSVPHSNNETVSTPLINLNVTAPYPISNGTINLNLNLTMPHNATATPDADYDASTDYTQDPNYVGAYGVLGMSMPNMGEPVMTEGNLPLTTCLMGKQHDGELESLAPEHVEPYLKKHLYYVIVGKDGVMDADKMPNFHINVKSTKAVPAKADGELPDLSAPFTTLPDATAHLPAGKPFKYVPQPIDVAYPSEDYPVGQMPNVPGMPSTPGQPAQSGSVNYPGQPGKPNAPVQSGSGNGNYPAQSGSNYPAQPNMPGKPNAPVQSGSGNDNYPAQSGNGNGNYPAQSGNGNGNYPAQSGNGNDNYPAQSGSNYPAQPNMPGKPNAPAQSGSYGSPAQSGSPSETCSEDQPAKTGQVSIPSGITPPWAEEGYCVTEQVVHYVDPAGNFLYAEM